MFNILIPPNTSPPTRRSHQKSRAGCRTCKDRKLKCDEGKPVCGQCQRHFVAPQPCHYVPSTRERAKVRTLRPKTQEPLSSSSEHRSGSVSVSQSEDEWDWKSALPKSLRAEMLDPFETHPESRVEGLDVLMRHYLKTVVYESFPWQPASETNPTTTYFVPLVWSDSVLFHATLQLTVLRLRNRVQRKTVNSGLLAAECIRLLRDRVENSAPENGVSDQTITAVATLAAVEHERGNMRMLRMHMDGVKRMIDIRGGLNAIRETNPMVANKIFWMFVVTIYEIPFPNIDPVLPPFFPRDHNLSYSPLSIVSHFQDIGPAHEEPTPLDLFLFGLTQPIATALNSVQHVSQLVPTHSTYPTAANSLTILTHLCTILSHLLSLPKVTPLAFPDLGLEASRAAALMSESARFAILLHVFTPWRGLPPDGTLTTNHLLHEMMCSLKVLHSIPNYTSNILLLWVFAVGGVAAFNMPERVWFVSHLADMTEEMGIESWEQMKACVSRCIWHERLLGKKHEKLWDEIVTKRRMLNGIEEQSDEIESRSKVSSP